MIFSLSLFCRVIWAERMRAPLSKLKDVPLGIISAQAMKRMHELRNFVNKERREQTNFSTPCSTSPPHCANSNPQKLSCCWWWWCRRELIEKKTIRVKSKHEKAEKHSLQPNSNSLNWCNASSFSNCFVLLFWFWSWYLCRYLGHLQESAEKHENRW